MVTPEQVNAAVKAARAGAASLRAAAAAARSCRGVCECAGLMAAAEAAEAAGAALMVRAKLPEELLCRQALARPVLEERIRAGREGRLARLSGAARATRNLAEHALLGQGPEVLQAACQNPQAAQRGGRRRRRASAGYAQPSAYQSESADGVATEHLRVGSEDDSQGVQTEAVSIGDMGSTGGVDCMGGVVTLGCVAVSVTDGTTIGETSQTLRNYGDCFKDGLRQPTSHAQGAREEMPDGGKQAHNCGD